MCAFSVGVCAMREEIPGALVMKVFQYVQLTFSLDAERLSGDFPQGLRHLSPKNLFSSSCDLPGKVLCWCIFGVI